MAFNFDRPISLLATASVALATFAPGIALSQSTPSNSRPAAQPATPSNRPAADVLNLTPEQLQQIRQISLNIQQQIEAVLTPEQRNKLNQAIESGQNPRAAILSLNLREEQVNRIRSINQTFNQQVRGVLTPEQLQRLQNQVQQQQNRQRGQ